MLNADLEAVGDCRHRRKLEAAGIGPTAVRRLDRQGRVTGERPGSVPEGHAVCARVGCDRVFEVGAASPTCCIHHPGPVSFKDGVKTWTCCKASSRDFSLFLGIPGCASATCHAVQGDVAPLQIEGEDGGGKGHDLLPATCGISDDDIARVANRAAVKIASRCGDDGQGNAGGQDPWAVLGLLGRPGPVAIDVARRVFTRLVHALHPDAGGPRASAKAFLIAQAAWEAIRPSNA